MSLSARKAGGTVDDRLKRTFSNFSVLRDTFSITCVHLIGKRAACRPNARIERSLLLRALHVGHRQFSRIEACLGEVGIEFAHFSRLRGEGGVRRPGIFGLDLNHGV
jgi:hypothetical protein